MALLAVLRTAIVNLVIPVAVGSAAFKGLCVIEDARLTATTMVALSGTLIGFMMASLSMLVSAADRPFLQNLRRSGHFKGLVREILTTVILWLAVIVVALAGHFVVGDYQRYVVAIATALLTLSFIHFIIVGRKFKMVIEMLSAN
ncbi:MULTISPECIES: hypothetical protein [Halomonadaceae]|uniref:hypothetical protein n=1 Tax=Halomonadaceae TaxID=28256 RepID=UPI0011C3B151|nr:MULTISPECIES: hypothetical protein [Halomonadaceae]